MTRWIAWAMAALLLGACKGSSEPILLGTLERDRITVPAEASERIVRIDVSEGDELESGQSILALDTVRIDASIEQARSWLTGTQWAPAIVRPLSG